MMKIDQCEDEKKARLVKALLHLPIMTAIT